jgi:small subunit ribosomal protein S13
LTDEEVSHIRGEIEKVAKVEGELRAENCDEHQAFVWTSAVTAEYVHRKGLPVRGQRTHTNARTRRGAKKNAIGRKKKA